MTKRRNADNYGSIVTQLDTWKSSYSLNSESGYGNGYFREHFEIFAKVIFSEDTRISNGDLIRFYIFVEHDMENYVSPPKFVGVFDRSKKCRTLYLSVHKSFIDNFRFMINNNIKPYFALSYVNRDIEKDIAITTFHLESEIEIDDFRTC